MNITEFDTQFTNSVAIWNDIYDAPLPHPRSHTTTSKRSSSTPRSTHTTNNRRNPRHYPTPTPTIVGKSVSFPPFDPTPRSWRNNSEHGLYPSVSSPWSYCYLNAPTPTKSYRDFTLGPQSWNPWTYDYLRSVHTPPRAKASYEYGLNAYPWVYQPWSYSSLLNGPTKSDYSNVEKNVDNKRHPYSWRQPNARSATTPTRRFYADLFPENDSHSVTKRYFDDSDLNPYSGRPWSFSAKNLSMPTKHYYDDLDVEYALRPQKYAYHGYARSGKQPLKRGDYNLYPFSGVPLSSHYLKSPPTPTLKSYYRDLDLDQFMYSGHPWRYPYRYNAHTVPRRSYDDLDLDLSASYRHASPSAPRRYFDDMDLYPYTKSSMSHPYGQGLYSPTKSYVGDLYYPYTSFSARGPTTATKRFYDDMDLELYRDSERPFSSPHVGQIRRSYDDLDIDSYRPTRRPASVYAAKSGPKPRLGHFNFERYPYSGSPLYAGNFRYATAPISKTRGLCPYPYRPWSHAYLLRGDGELAEKTNYLDASRRRYGDLLGPDYETNRRVDALVDYDIPKAMKSLSSVRDQMNEVKGGMGTHRMLIDRYLTLDLGPSQEVDYEVAKKYYELAARMPELEPDKYHRRALYSDGPAVNLSGAGRSRSVPCYNAGNISHYGQFNQPVSELRNKLRKVITKSKRDPTFYSY
ncbi:uncharacterized protein LOC135496036 [Lineus longissimus]|uniref:uncharacterized protein LOC135496036 n=1 Tax=Lineus longissimus TaxID=88925 RepID=UPI00315D235B